MNHEASRDDREDKEMILPCVARIGLGVAHIFLYDGVRSGIDDERKFISFGVKAANGKVWSIHR